MDGRFVRWGLLFRADDLADLSETVFGDYLATNHSVHDETERRLFFIRIASFLRTHPDQVRPLLGVRREYLQAAFGASEAKYGTIDAYLREALGITHAEARTASRVGAPMSGGFGECNSAQRSTP